MFSYNQEQISVERMCDDVEEWGMDVGSCFRVTETGLTFVFQEGHYP